jgi:hypothetical protein
MKIIHILTQFLNFFDIKKKREQEADYRYLAESVSRADLERRMRELEFKGRI